MTRALLVVGAALVVLTMVLWRTAWRRVAVTASVAVFAYASTLSLIDAPPYTVYQHLRLWPPWLEGRPVALLGLALQLALCVVLYRGWLRPALDALSAGPGRLRAAIVALVLLFAAAVPASSIAASLAEIAASALLMLLALANLLLVAMAVPADRWERAVRWVSARISIQDIAGDEPRPLDRLVPWVGAAWAGAAGVLLSVVVFEGVPHIDDSVSYLFQAKYFAAGRFDLPVPPDSAAFHVDQAVMESGRWFAYGFPGWPALLALGVLGGVPWLVNPLLGALAVALAFALVRRTHGRGTANATVLLLCVSPWFLFMSGEMLGHQAALVWLLLAMLGVQRSREGRGALWPAVAGLALGMVFLTRPLDGLLAGIVLAAWALGVAGAPRIPLKAMAIGALPFAAAGILGLAYNRAVTGSALLTPHRMWMDRAWGAGSDRLGFGADIGNRAWPNIDPLPGHGLADVVLNLNKNLFQTNVDLLGWGFGSLLFVLAFLVSRHQRREDRYLVALACVFPAGYSLYWFSGGPDHGARYWYLALVPLVVLTVRGLQAAGRSPASRLAPSAFAGVALAASVLTMALFLPWRSATKYHRYRGISRDLGRLAAANGVRDALVFVEATDRADYQSAINLNPPLLEGPGNSYARFLSPESRTRVASAFPARPIWVLSKRAPEPSSWVASGPYPPGSPPR